MAHFTFSNKCPSLRDEEIEWRFNNTRIARVTKNTATYDNDVKFTDRLQLDIQTGDLKIRSFRITDSGLYKFEISSPRVSSEKTFSVSGVSDTGVKSVSVLVGDSVTLNTDVPDTQICDEIQWRFDHQNSPVAEINRIAGIFNTSDGADGRFRHRLQLDYRTGSLTIRFIGNRHSGLYEADITSTGIKHTIHKSFNVTVSDAVKSELVTEGETVTLQTNVSEIQKDDQILWIFGDIVIAEIYKAAQRFHIYDGPDERFRGKLNLDNQTGSLIITDTRITHSGLYEVEISSSRHIILRRITVTVSGDSGLSRAAVVGIAVAVILVLATVAAVQIYHHHKISNLERCIAPQRSQSRRKYIWKYLTVKTLEGSHPRGLFSA
ncbi:uncharacterized protein [Sinocyclocheilus grahami]|uniref:uncharacterized protein n=1 Tax=Sinocyclocheilus grahami TaxID=75366 RepID=UPI0007AD3B51|nr:PREDICTED: uncharacterized protein LOC107568437 [Sinocyclocheilus grahami]